MNDVYEELGGRELFFSMLFFMFFPIAVAIGAHPLISIIGYVLAYYIYCAVEKIYRRLTGDLDDD